MQSLTYKTKHTLKLLGEATKLWPCPRCLQFNFWIETSWVPPPLWVHLPFWWQTTEKERGCKEGGKRHPRIQPKIPPETIMSCVQPNYLLNLARQANHEVVLESPSSWLISSFTVDYGSPVYYSYDKYHDHCNSFGLMYHWIIMQSNISAVSMVVFGIIGCICDGIHRIAFGTFPGMSWSTSTIARGREG